MKQIWSFLLILTIAFNFAGCSSKTTNQKSEAEIRAEIKAEMEAEQKKNEALKEEEKTKEEKVIGPVNMAIKNYVGEGLERLSKMEVDCKEKYGLSGKEVRETLAIFGEVTNVKIGYIQLFTEGNYSLMEKFDSIKDTQLSIRRASIDDVLITVSFYDKGFREHTVAFTSSHDDLTFIKTEDKAELAVSLEEKYKAKTAYKDRSDLILKSLAEKKFLSSNIFNNIQEKVEEYDGSKFYQVDNEPLGYSFYFYRNTYVDGNAIKYSDDISQIYISPNEGYSSIKNDAKCSFFGIDFDMPIYQARYNMNGPKDSISIELVEDYEEAGKLMGIRISKVRE